MERWREGGREGEGEGGREGGKGKGKEGERERRKNEGGMERKGLTQLTLCHYMGGPRLSHVMSCD